MKTARRNPYEAGKKYRGNIPEVRYLPVSVIYRREYDFKPETLSVSDAVARGMDYSKPIEVTAYRFAGSGWAPTSPPRAYRVEEDDDETAEVMLEDGHHRLAAAIQTGRRWLPVNLTAINAKGEKLNALIALSQQIEAQPNPSTAKRTHPALWERIVDEVTAGGKGGRPGQWSARKAQRAVALYQKRGGGYVGPKTPDNALAKWTREKWRTRSGRPSLETGERYLPAKAIAALSPQEYGATTRAKRAGMRRGEQFTAQPERIARKAARYRKNPALPTAQYDALAASLRREYPTFTNRLLEDRTLGLSDLLAEWADANGVDYLGSGWHRLVFRVPEGALKISVQHIDFDRTDGNLSEARVWNEAPPAIRKHLVPVLAVAEDGKWLLQEYAPSTGRPQTAKEEARVEARWKALSRCGFTSWREISGNNAADDGRVLDYASVQDGARWQKCVEKAAAKSMNPTPVRRARRNAGFPMDNFAFFPTGTSASPIAPDFRARGRDELEARTGVPAPIFDVGSILKESEPEVEAAGFYTAPYMKGIREVAWAVVAPDAKTAAQATTIGKRLMKKMIPRTKLAYNLPMLVGCPLYVAYPGGVVRVEPASKT